MMSSSGSQSSRGYDSTYKSDPSLTKYLNSVASGTTKKYVGCCTLHRYFPATLRLAREDDVN